MPICKNCQKEFTIYPEDQEFYQKIEVPEPTWCPECRSQRRLAFRNERNLYKRKCDLCGQEIISIYSEEKPFQVYCQKCWWSDQWDPLEYGREFDFSRPFFEQLKELLKVVPKVSLYNIKAENAEYCNFCMGNRNCYLVFGSDKNRSCHYSLWIYECRDVIDCSYCYNSELLYQCIDCMKCYHCQYCQDCESSSHCFLSSDLKSCKNCFGCTGLRHKENYIFNQKVSLEEFNNFVDQIQDILSYQKKMEKIRKEIPRKSSHFVNSRNFIGDFIINSQNIFYSFDVRNGQNIRYSNDIFDQARDCWDCSFSGEIELCYDSYEIHGYDLKFCDRTWPSTSSTYLDNCDNCSDCFACVGLRYSKNCIFNKQYKESEYLELKEKIINHMKKTRLRQGSGGQAGEWGEYPPIELSPFAYNETVANEYFPLSKEEVLAKSWQWQEEKDKPVIPGLPQCGICGKNFKIIPQEEKFYSRMNLPLPDKCPNCRHLARLKLRNPRQLWDQKCDKCGKEIKTSYAPDCPEKVYCEECYQKEIY